MRFFVSIDPIVAGENKSLMILPLILKKYRLSLKQQLKRRKSSLIFYLIIGKFCKGQDQNENDFCEGYYIQGPIRL